MTMLIVPMTSMLQDKKANRKSWSNGHDNAFVLLDVNKVHCGQRFATSILQYKMELLP